MSFGLALDLLNFSKSVEFKRHMINFYRDTDTLELLTSLIVLCLRKSFNFESEKTPTMSNIGWYLGEIFSRYTPIETHSIYKCFFTHLFVWEREGIYPVPYFIRIEDSFYISPLFQEHLSYAPEVFSIITKQESPFLFNAFDIYPSKDFNWQVTNSWVSGLLKYVIQRNNEPVLMLAQLSEKGEFPVRHALFRFYTLLFDTFKTFPFTSDEAQNKEVIYQYIIIIRDFLKVRD